MTLEKFLKNEVDEFDADSASIYLKLDKDKYFFPVMPTTKSELRLWAILNFVSCGDEVEGIRVESEDKSKELEVYKKALILACKELSFRDCKEQRTSAPITVRYNQEFLQKAREQSDD